MTDFNPIILPTIGAGRTVINFIPNVDLRETERMIQIHDNEMALLNAFVPKNNGRINYYTK